MLLFHSAMIHCCAFFLPAQHHRTIVYEGSVQSSVQVPRSLVMHGLCRERWNLFGLLVHNVRTLLCLGCYSPPEPTTVRKLNTALQLHTWEGIGQNFCLLGVYENMGSRMTHTRIPRCALQWRGSLRYSSDQLLAALVLRSEGPFRATFSADETRISKVQGNYMCGP